MNKIPNIERGQIWEEFDIFNNLKGKQRQYIIIGIGAKNVQFLAIDGTRRRQCSYDHFLYWYRCVGSVV